MRCEHCHIKLAVQVKRRGEPRRYCSNKCRIAAFHARNEAENKARIQWLYDHVSFDGDECLTWPFTLVSGYAGTVLVNGRHQRACRVMCELAHGPAPESKRETAHSCGKGDEACINPKHLRWATHAENGADRKLHALERKALQLESSKQPVETLDLLEGAAAIALFVHGDPRKRRKVYDMDPNILGLFHMGRTLCGLKSEIRKRIAARAAGQSRG